MTSLLRVRRAGRLMERNAVVTFRTWPVFVTGLFEPVLYLFSLGIGLAELVGDLPGPAGEPIGYAQFVAPGMLAAAAMNGAIMDSTFNVFFKLKYAKTYDAMLATPVGVPDVAAGETAWSLVRGGIYSTAFLVVMAAFGFVDSVLGVLAVPACLLVGYAFAGAGLAFTSRMRSWQDFDLVLLSTLPLFLFSATFYPLSTYPEALQWVVRATPLYQGVELTRGFVLGVVDWTMLGHAAYLLAMGSLGLWSANRRLRVLLTP